MSCTPSDILSVKDIIYQASSRRLPLELIDIIIDHAEYWACTTVETRHSFIASGQSYGRRPETQDKLILRTAPLGYNVSEAGQEYSLDLDQFTDTSLRTNSERYEPSDEDEDVTSEVLKSWKRTQHGRGAHVCRKIVFTIKSHDQGWAGAPYELHGTYGGSYTWFDVGKESFRAVVTDQMDLKDKFLSRVSTKDEQRIVLCTLEPVDPPLAPPGSQTILTHPLLPDGRRLQSNKTATKDPLVHVITWRLEDSIDPESSEADELDAQGRGRETGSGEFVKNLELGDVITLWARARFASWSNTVESAKIDVYWAV